MRTSALTLVVAVSLLSGFGCQRSDQEAARERADNVKRKAEAAAQRLEQEADKLGAKIKEKGQEVGATRQSGTEASPEEKLKRGAAELTREGQEAGAKLSQVSQSAKVKYNISASLGLSAASKIHVNSDGDAVVLQGSVANADQKAKAESAAVGTAGVTKVVNALRIQP